MKSRTYFTDEGLILKKSVLKDEHHRVTVFTREHGKISLASFGTKKLTSKRISHLETGNVVSLAWSIRDDFSTLAETELRYAHSHIKEDSHKLDIMYLAFFVLHAIIPDETPEPDVYEATLSFLRDLHAGEASIPAMEAYLRDVLMRLGFLDEAAAKDVGTDVLAVVEGITGRKLGI